MTSRLNFTTKIAGHSKKGMQENNTGQSRIGKLDSVRGIASLMVVIGHCGGPPLFGQLAQNPNLWWLRAFWDGESAVIMFFLLSGFVLALQLNRPQRPTYWEFLVRRFLRIWPAFAVVVGLAFAALNWTHTPVDAGQHHGPPSVPGYDALLQNMFMVGSPYTIVPPVWSLYVEARLSIVFPLLLLIAMRYRMGWAILLSTVLSVSLSRLVHLEMPQILISMAESSRYIVLFVIGAALALPENPIAPLYRRLSPTAKAAGLTLAFVCLIYRFYPSDHPLPLAGYVRWFGVTLLFIFCLYSKVAEGLLNHRPLLFLGRVSYGVYLAHMPVMLLFRPYVSSVAFCSVVLVGSILVGWAINCWIEQPAILLGRRLFRRE